MNSRGLKKEEKVILNKYGRLRLNYLKEHKKAEYTILFMEEQLNKHLKEIQEVATKRVNDIMTKLKAESDLTEDMKDSNPLYWVGTMNSIKQQAEEIVLNELTYTQKHFGTGVGFDLTKADVCAYNKEGWKKWYIIIKNY